MTRPNLPSGSPTALVCAGCGHRVPENEPAPLACPHAVPGDDIDHVLSRLLDAARVGFPHGREANPFTRYRELFHAYHVGRALGWSDGDYVARVDGIDADIAGVDGRGFRVTPFSRSDALGERLGFSAAGGVLVKDETGNVAGSHKARHLMGTLVELEAGEALRRAHSPGGTAPGGTAPGGPAPGEPPPLAIASCGNAALAAAVVARAAGRTLDVFIPVHANPAVVARLRDLGARLTVCERDRGVRGDPTYQRMLHALANGAVAFTCQGTLNGFAIEGGATLGYEMVSQLAETGRRLDRVFVQVGGGALASAVAQAFLEARDLGVIDRLPRIHAVQTLGGYPLARAYDRVVARLGDRLRDRPEGGAIAGPLDLADPSVRDVLAFAARHRSMFMWPWAEEPKSIATGILDDETYDWLAVVRGMLASGGSPVVVGEATLLEANELARSATGVHVDPTGSAGLAGLMDLARRGDVRPDETVAVLFTGITRRFVTPAPRGATRALAAPLADLIDPDPGQAGERVADRSRVGDDPGDDRPDRPPGDPGEGPDRALRAVPGQPGDLVVQGPGVAGPMAGPGHGGHDDPVDRAANPGGLGLEVGLRRPEVGRPPAPPPVSRVIARAAPATEPAAVTIAALQPHPHDERAGRLLEHRVLHDRPLDTDHTLIPRTPSPRLGGA